MEPKEASSAQTVLNIYTDVRAHTQACSVTLTPPHLHMQTHTPTFPPQPPPHTHIHPPPRTHLYKFSFWLSGHINISRSITINIPWTFQQAEQGAKKQQHQIEFSLMCVFKTVAKRRDHIVITCNRPKPKPLFRLVMAQAWIRFIFCLSASCNNWLQHWDLLITKSNSDQNFSLRICHLLWRNAKFSRVLIIIDYLWHHIS